MLAFHRVYEGEIGKKDLALYVSDGGAAKHLKGAAIAKWVKALPLQSTLLSTSAHIDALALLFIESGHTIRSAHWHGTGIAKNLPADAIVEQFAALPADTTFMLRADPDIYQLKALVATRRWILDVRKAGTLRLKGAMRARGLGKDDPLPSDLAAMAEEMEVIRRGRKAEGDQEAQKGVETECDKDIARLALQIPACRIFMEVADLSGGVQSAALVVACVGDIRRFSRVSSLWHYAGMHVTDGHAPKREAGRSMDWNPKLREGLFNLGVSIIKNRDNRWRAIYDAFRDHALIHHEAKCGCAYPDGHTGAQARRRILKEILKDFWIRCQDELNSESIGGGQSVYDPQLIPAASVLASAA